MVRQQLLDLHAIQNIDLEIRELEKKRDDLPAKANALEQETAKLKSEISTLTMEREELDSEIAAAQKTIDEESTKYKKWDRRLNDIRNQREYMALNREVEGAKRAVKQAEERTLEVQVQVEEFNKKISALEEKLAEADTDRDEELKRIQDEVNAIGETISSETARRDGLIPTIPTRLYKVYDQVRQKRAGIGIVSATGGSCTGCNMKLPPQLYNQLMRVEAVEQCPSCRRIVFYSGILETNTEATA